MIKESVNFFTKNGYAILPGFISPQKCQAAVKQIDRLISTFVPSSQSSIIFTTKNWQKFSQDYFLKSSNNVSYFLQEKAFQNGKLTIPKQKAINKIGHALHEHNQLFKNITFQRQIGLICNQVPIQDPVVVQSMAILKPPKIGGNVCVHQDSTYLYDENETLVGFWIPLQDATIHNGCLWGLPGSHKGPLYLRSLMDWNTKKLNQAKLHQNDFKQSDFVPLEMKRGSLVFFTGRFLHKSHPNTSEKSRYAYTWHLKSNSSKWSSQNWLQRQKFPIFEFNEKQK